MLRILVLPFLFAAGLAHAREETAADLPSSDPDPRPGPALVRNDDLEFVRRRGVELYERHQATLLALEAAREVGLSDIAPKGWITVAEGNGLRVRFVGDCEERPCALLDVLIDSARLDAEALYPPVALTALERDAWRAKQLIFARQEVTCPVPYNAVAFPPDEEGGTWTVYLVPQPEEGDVVALSGHMRVRVDPAAGAVLAAEDYSERCMLLRRTPEQSQMVVETAWASMPAETHVLNSLLHQLVFYVGTSGGVFRVDGNVIERVSDLDPGT